MSDDFDALEALNAATAAPFASKRATKRKQAGKRSYIRSRLEADVASIALHAEVVKAIRQSGVTGILQGHPAVLSITLPDVVELDIARLVATVLCDEMPVSEGHYEIIVAKDPVKSGDMIWEQARGASLNFSAFLGVRRRARHVILIGHGHHYDALEPAIRSMFDVSIAVCEHPSVDILRGAMALAFHEPVSAADAGRAHRGTWAHWQLLLDPQRGLARSLKDLESTVDIGLSAKQPTDTVPAAPRHGFIPLSAMALPCDLAEWADRFTADVISYRAGQLDWSQLDKGFVLAGPPGCGKSVFARSLAEAVGAPIFEESIAEWWSRKTGHLGDWISAAKDIFKRASEAAFQDGLAIIFLDEIDSIGNRQGFEGRNKELMTDCVNAMLALLDEGNRPCGVVVVGATNDAGRIDPALLRPGRLDRVLAMGMPDLGARAAMFKWHLHDAALAIEFEDAAELADGMSAAEIEQACRDARKRARGRSITLEDIYPKPDEPYEQTWATAVHEAGHAIVAEVLMPGSVQSIVIRDRQTATGTSAAHTSIKTPYCGREGFMTRSDIEDLVAVLLGGVAAEDMYLKERRSGSASDLRAATTWAARLHSGVGHGSLLYTHDPASDGEVSLHLMRDPDFRNAVHHSLGRALHRAAAILDAEKNAAIALAKQLATTGYARGASVREVIGKQSSLTFAE